MRVLVCGATGCVGAAVVHALRSRGHKVVEAARGLADGRSTMHVDYMQPRRPDAWAAALRSAQWATPVILITAFGDEAIRAEARELGAFAILEKPRDLEELRTDVLRTLSLACAAERKRSR